MDHSQTLNDIMKERTDIQSRKEDLQNPAFKEYLSSFGKETEYPNVLFW